MNIKQKGSDLLLKLSIKKDMRPEWICFTIYYVEKKIYNQKHHYQPWIPTQESRKTHTLSNFGFLFKKKNENKNKVFNLTNNYWVGTENDAENEANKDVMEFTF